MSLSFIVIGLGLAVLAVGIAVVWGSRQSAAEFRSLRPRKVGEVQGEEGLVALEGRAACDEPLIAPVSKAPCVFYKVEVFEKRPQLNRRDAYQRVSGSTHWALWRLEDETGSLPVDGEGAEVVATEGATVHSGGLTLRSEGDEVLRGLGLESSALVVHRVEELHIPVGARLLVRAIRRDDGYLAGESKMLVSAKSAVELAKAERGASGVGILLAVVGAVMVAYGVGVGVKVLLEESRAEARAAEAWQPPLAPWPGER